jgi:hypothetical protein
MYTFLIWILYSPVPISWKLYFLNVHTCKFSGDSYCSLQYLIFKDELKILPTVTEDLRLSHESWNRYVHLLLLCLLRNVWTLLRGCSQDHIYLRVKFETALETILSQVTLTFSWELLFFKDFLHSVAVCRHDSGKCCSFLPYLAIFGLSYCKLKKKMIFLIV